MILFESERELEDMLCEQLEAGYWSIEDQMVDSYFRQLSLGDYGVVDLALFSKEFDLVNDEEKLISQDLTIVELKITELKADSLSQISRYKSFFDEHHHNYNLKYILVCKYAESYKGDLVLLAQQLDWLDVYTYRFSLDKGIKFSHLHGFSPIEDAERSEKTLQRMNDYFGAE